MTQSIFYFTSGTEVSRIFTKVKHSWRTHGRCTGPRTTHELRLIQVRQKSSSTATGGYGTVIMGKTHVTGRSSWTSKRNLKRDHWLGENEPCPFHYSGLFVLNHLIFETIKSTPTETPCQKRQRVSRGRRTWGRPVSPLNELLCGTW